MEFSDFGNKLTSRSGILLLMDDLGRPLPDGIKPYPLGGGNPARVPEAEKAWRESMERILSDDSFENLLSHYDSPQGRLSFIDAVRDSFNERYGWNLKRENIAVTNGSQSAMFYLFNLFAGKHGESFRRILFPLMPEYIGYRDQGIDMDMMRSVPSVCEYYDDHTFKYLLDADALCSYLDTNDDISAIAVTRPTNPSGNVLRDDEIALLSELSEKHNIPLIIDNAYGLPFPDIIFQDAEPVWNENIVLSMSLSKIGLPSLRCGIIIAKPEITEAISNINAIAALASSSIGQALAEDLIRSGRLMELAESAVKPFYKKKAENAEDAIRTSFEGTDYYYHRIEGSIFCWLYLPDLNVPAIDFYSILKSRGVITVPGEYFFFGHGGEKEGIAYPHPHYDKCLRINYSSDDQTVRDGIAIIAEEYRKHS